MCMQQQQRTNKHAQPLGCEALYLHPAHTVSHKHSTGCIKYKVFGTAAVATNRHTPSNTQQRGGLSTQGDCVQEVDNTNMH